MALRNSGMGRVFQGQVHCEAVLACLYTLSKGKDDITWVIRPPALHLYFFPKPHQPRTITTQKPVAAFRVLTSLHYPTRPQMSTFGAVEIREGR